MVIGRKSPFYSLGSVQQLQDFVLAGQYTRQDVDELGFDTDNVLATIRGLRAADFRGTKVYQGRKYDVYKTLVRIEPPDRWDDAYSQEIYIKLRLTRQNTMIFLASFHKDR